LELMHVTKVSAQKWLELMPVEKVTVEVAWPIPNTITFWNARECDKYV